MSWLKDYFSFTKRERNAFIALLVIIAAFIFLPDLFSAKRTPVAVSDKVKKERAQSKEKNDPATQETGSSWETPFSDPKQKRETRLFEFDPNTLDEDGFITLGLPERTARTLINYRNKGGRFRKPDDLRKIYSLKKEDADRIIPYARIGIANQYEKNNFYKDAPAPTAKKEVKLFEFDPNTLGEEGFVTLGLPERTAKTIINYRNKGGRFRNPEDLRKIYSLQKEDADRIIPFARIASDNAYSKTAEDKKEYAPKTINIININTATAEEWKSLPGIGEILSARIVKFRQSLGGFTSVDQVAKTYGLKDSTFQLIKPYLKL